MTGRRVPADLAHRLPAAALALLAPLGALAAETAVADPDAPPPLVAEALFLCDPLPPWGRDVNLQLAVAHDADAGAVAFSPRMQLAVSLGERAGVTADVGVGTDGGVPLQAPGASLKVLLRAPDAGTTGLAMSVDLFGPTHSALETEAGLGLGAIRAVGRVALRASASVASQVSGWTPHLHGGASAALSLGPSVRALVEMIADLTAGELALAAGPTIKVALSGDTALMAGALLPVGGAGATPTFAFQLTRSL